MAYDKTKAIETAEAHLEHGDIKRAAHQLGKVCRHDPDDLRNHLKLADLYQKMGRLEVSLKTLLYVAEHYVDDGHLLKAITVYNKMLSIDAGLHTIHLSLARAYSQLGLVNDATSQYLEVVHILTLRERVTERLDVIRELLDLNPDNIASRVRLAEEYYALGRGADGTAQLKFAADTLEEKGRSGEFIRVAERLVFHDTENFGIRLRLAHHYMGRDDVYMALPHLRACFAETPDDVEVMDLLAEYFAQMGQEAKAILVFRALANRHNRNRLIRERDAVLERLMALDPNNEEAQEWLERSANPDVPSVAEEIEFDDIDIDEIFLDEGSVEVLIEAETQGVHEGSGELPPPLPDESEVAEELTVVEQEIESQSGELLVTEAEESVLEAALDVEEDLPEVAIEMESFETDEPLAEGPAIDVDLELSDDESDALAAAPVEETVEVVEEAAPVEETVEVVEEAAPVEETVEEAAPAEEVVEEAAPAEETVEVAEEAALAPDVDADADVLEVETTEDLAGEMLVEEEDLDPASQSTDDINWFGDDDEPTGVAHVDATELDSDVLKPLPVRPASRHRLAVPMVLVDLDDDVEGLEEDDTGLSSDVPHYRGTHRVAVPLSDDDSWAFSSDYESVEDEDGLIVEVLVDDDGDFYDDSDVIPSALVGSLDEFDFFIQNGFHAEAEAVLTDMERLHSGHPEVLRRREVLHDSNVSTW